MANYYLLKVFAQFFASHSSLTFYELFAIMIHRNFPIFILTYICTKNPLMDTAKCKEFLQTKVGTVATAFSNDLQKKRDKILSCLYGCLKKSFIKWATIAYNSYPYDFIEQLSDNSFTDCILKFKEVASGKGLYVGNASIKTVVFAFFKNTLRENLQKENRLAAKYQHVNLEDAGTAVEIDDDVNKENLYRLLETALRQMKEDDRQIITWRHMEEKSNEEIASLLNITVPSATNRIYRCMERLKTLIGTTNK